MKKTKILFLMILLSLQMVFISGLIKPETVFAQTQENQKCVSDKIEVKVRYYNGRYQYRRWNATKQCWVDPNWIDM